MDSEKYIIKDGQFVHKAFAELDDTEKKEIDTQWAKIPSTITVSNPSTTSGTIFNTWAAPSDGPLQYAKVFDEPLFKDMRVAQRFDDDALTQYAFIEEDGTEWEAGISDSAGLMWLDKEGAEFQPEDSEWVAANKFYAESLKRKERDSYLVSASTETDSSSVRVHQAFSSYKFARPRNAKVQKYFGIANSTGKAVFFAMNPVQSYAYLCHQGVDTETAEEVDAEIKQMRKWNDPRPAVVVVEGDESWCRDWGQKLTEPSTVIYVSDEATLESLGVEIVDKDWQSGQEPVNVDRHIASGLEDWDFAKVNNKGVTPDGRPFALADLGPQARAKIVGDQSNMADDAPEPQRRRGSAKAGSGSPHTPPKTVQRSSDASAMPEWDDLASKFAMGQAPPPENPDTGDDDFDISKAAQVMEEIESGGQHEVFREEDTAPQILSGQRVVEAASGTGGTVVLVDDDTKEARVQFDDRPQGSLDDISFYELIPQE